MLSFSFRLGIVSFLCYVCLCWAGRVDENKNLRHSSVFGQMKSKMEWPFSRLYNKAHETEDIHKCGDESAGKSLSLKLFRMILYLMTNCFCEISLTNSGEHDDSNDGHSNNVVLHFFFFVFKFIYHALGSVLLILSTVSNKHDALLDLDKILAIRVRTNEEI